VNDMLLPYDHPTTVVIVDDNDWFLHTLDLRMPADMSYLSFHDARAALKHVNTRSPLPPISERCFSSNGSASAWKDPMIQLDLTLIEQEIKNPERFMRTSIVVVDYAMPEMNGLEFCREVTDRSIKRVLLTGVADEKLAVQAFNDGIIDRFLPKNEDGALDLVVKFTRDLQRRYFLEQQKALEDSLRADPPQFLSDAAIVRHFAALQRKIEFVEHYLVGDPPGFIFVTASGLLYRLVVLSDRDVEAQVEFAKNAGAPRSILDSLSTRDKVGFFFDDPQGAGEEGLCWSDYLHDATPVVGRERWLTALVRDPPIDVDYTRERASFQSHLDRVDALREHLRKQSTAVRPEATPGFGPSALQG